MVLLLPASLHQTRNTTTIVDFNAKSKSWYINDSTTSQGKVLENITSQFGLLQQIIKEPTHILNHCSSRIDFIFHITVKFNI